MRASSRKRLVFRQNIATDNNDFHLLYLISSHQTGPIRLALAGSRSLELRRRLQGYAFDQSSDRQMHGNSIG